MLAHDDFAVAVVDKNLLCDDSRVDEGARRERLEYARADELLGALARGGDGDEKGDFLLKDPVGVEASFASACTFPVSVSQSTYQDCPKGSLQEASPDP